jgi:hypothetical protein
VVPHLPISKREMEACVCGRVDAREKSQMTEDLYEIYDEEKDVYSFTIV